MCKMELYPHNDAPAQASHELHKPATYIGNADTWVLWPSDQCKPILYVSPQIIECVLVDSEADSYLGARYLGLTGWSVDMTSKPCKPDVLRLRD